ncbi:S8 family serine peptidase [Solirubrobacter phytolaccae]|uniref:S8 family serine peptidase n=1 Tax=Solirubrobacter phytolaccae TaxID=1404360 RepID=A0A9X3NBW1_9ACTN|nr:S8 family serine peptidase [Solirubrobacter phytolaccae]MDA0179922.1 S8 family serine peptidase [Solirubrobacter phytolaccae]
MTRAVLAATLVLLLSAPAAHAAVPEFPQDLPGEATASAVRSDPDTWLVGAEPGAEAKAVAARFGARHSGLGNYVVERDQARGFAHALEARGLLLYSQANTVLKSKQAVPDDPLSVAPNNWRARLVSPATVPPPVTPESPLIALVDAAADPAHPEWVGSAFATIPGTPVTNSHGTATASVAAAPQNGVGILGVWPGARALNVPLATTPGVPEGGITCAASGEAIGKAVAAGAAVINMSYGSPSRCAAEWVQLYFALAKGVIPVAAAGNEFQDGNPLEFPASLPHVVTVAATTPDDRSASFSNANAAVDLSAPGVGIMTAVPPALDTDGVQDGYQIMDGTSFSAPMVSAALAWVRAARPDLTPDRVVQAVRLTARDIVSPDGQDRPGWDPLTGFGVLNIDAALTVAADKLPIQDPYEPNDNLVWVDGTAFGKPSTPIWQGGKSVQVDALLDKQEDPVDVYRIVIGGKKSATVKVIPRFGDPSLEVFTTEAVSVNDLDGRVAKSRKSGSKKTEQVTVRNNGSKKRSYFLVVKPQGSSRYQERQYSLRVR